MRVEDIPAIKELSAAERILLVEDLWDSITPDEAAIEAPQSHREELDRRQQSYEANPGDLLTLEELQKRIADRR